MLSKVWFCALALAAGCRLGTPRPDGSEAPADSTAPGPNSSASAKTASAAPAASSAPAPAILMLPTDLADSTGTAAPPGSAYVNAAASAPPSARPPHRIAVLGDSLSDPRVGGGGYVAALGKACRSSPIENFAKGGFMVNQIRRRFEAQLLARLPSDFDELIVFGGVNDLYSDETAGRSVEKISADLAAIYRAAKARGTRVIALTVTPWGGFSRYYNPRRAAATRRLNDWIREQSQSGLVDVVIDAYPLLACGERLCPEYEPPFRDGIHFGKVGQQKLGDALIQQAFADCRAPSAARTEPDRAP